MLSVEKVDILGHCQQLTVEGVKAYVVTHLEKGENAVVDAPLETPLQASS